MRLPVERDLEHANSTIMPPAMFAGFNPLSVLIFTPLFFWGMYPLLERLARSRQFPLLYRIRVGMVVAFLSLTLATVVEFERSDSHRWDFLNTTDRLSPNATLYVSSLSIIWQVPQYTLSGAAEVLVIISSKCF